jgi:hypothetical protein
MNSNLTWIGASNLAWMQLLASKGSGQGGGRPRLCSPFALGVLQLGPGSQGWITSPWWPRSSQQIQRQYVLMIWRPCRRDIKVGPYLFEIILNMLSNNCSLTSIALRMDELWPFQWSTVGMPMNWKFKFYGLSLWDTHCTYKRIMTCTCGTKWVVPKITIQIYEWTHLIIINGCIRRCHVLVKLTATTYLC